jgi:preprotein translocase subunit YajC
VSSAFAQSSPGAPAGGRPTDLVVLIGGIFAIFYFLVLRPDQKRRKEHDALLAGLKRNDEVVLNCGIHGRVTQLGDGQVITIEIAPKVQIDVERDAIARVPTAPTKDA